MTSYDVIASCCEHQRKYLWIYYESSNPYYHSFYGREIMERRGGGGGELGILPAKLTAFRVKPWYKNTGRRNDTYNYCPISVIKRFEPIILPEKFQRQENGSARFSTQAKYNCQIDLKLNLNHQRFKKNRCWLWCTKPSTVIPQTVIQFFFSWWYCYLRVKKY